MADLTKKKNTSKLRHINSRNIRAAQVDMRDEDNPQLVISFEENDVEHYLPVTKEVYAMVTKGTGLSHPRLRYGLLNCSKFRFKLVTDKLKSKKKKDDTEGKETITAIHLIPDHPYNQCDWSEELGRRIDDDIAVAYIDPGTGAIAVYAFPRREVSSLDSFVSGLEKLTSIDGSTTFKSGEITYQVSQIYGNEVTFRCTAPARPVR